MIEIPFKSSVVTSLGHVVYLPLSQMVKHIGVLLNISEMNMFFWLYKYLRMVGNVNTTELHDLKTGHFLSNYPSPPTTQTLLGELLFTCTLVPSASCSNWNSLRSLPFPGSRCHPTSPRVVICHWCLSSTTAFLRWYSSPHNHHAFLAQGLPGTGPHLSHPQDQRRLAVCLS